MKREIVFDGIKMLWKAVVILALYETANIYLNLSIGSILGDFTGYILSYDIPNTINNLGLLLGCIVLSTLMMPLIGLAGNYFLFVDSLKHDRYIFNQYYNLPFNIQRKIPFGEVQYRIENDPNNFRITLVFMLKYVLCILISAYGIVYMLAKLNPVMMVIVLGLSVIKWFIASKIGKLTAEYQKRDREFNTQLRNYEMDISYHLDMFLLYRWGNNAYRKIHNFVADGLQNFLKNTFWGKAIADTIEVIINSVFPVIILLSGCIEVKNGKIEITSILTILVMFPAIEKVITMVDYCIKNKKYMNDILERMLFFYSSNQNKKKEMIKSNESIIKITGKNLSYTYGEKVVFENLCFEITHKKTAIYGENGKGKSTLVKMLCGFLCDYEGEIYIGNQKLKENEEEWFKKFSYIPQNPYVFDASLAENIAMSECYNEDAVNQVIELTGIAYLSNRDISNTSVSGGERQRIALARAIYSGRDWSFMDEPTNNLDKETINWLQNFISQTEKTLIFITHDKSTADKAQEILCL